LKNIIGLRQQPPSTDSEFAERLHTVLPYFMHDPDKAYLMADAMEGGSVSVWNFLNQSRCDDQLKFSAWKA